MDLKAIRERAKDILDNSRPNEDITYERGSELAIDTLDLLDEIKRLGDVHRAEQRRSAERLEAAHRALNSVDMKKLINDWYNSDFAQTGALMESIRQLVLAEVSKIGVGS